MDDRTFDRLTRVLGTTRSRRVAIGALVTANPLLSLLGASAKRRHQRNHTKDRKQRKEKARASAQAEPCWRAGACIPKKGANVSQCDLAGYTAPTGLNCTGCNLSQANLRGANLGGVNFTKANLSGACLIDANLSGATIANNTNLSNAIFCRTTMPNGSVNDSGCSAGTACCSPCIPATCASLGNVCGTVPDGCGSTLECDTCTPGDVCVGTPQATCQACTFATAQADGCAVPSAHCGHEEIAEPPFTCFCARTTSGGAICTRFAKMLRGCDPVSPICPTPPCATDADCVARGYTHCVTCSGAGGNACAFACIPCPNEEFLCGETCCPVSRSCCRGVCCAATERCRGTGVNRQCTPV